MIGGAVALGTVAGYLRRLGWLCELASHFRAQYFGILLLSTWVFSLANRPLEAIISAGLALANLWLLVPLYIGRDRTTTGQTFRALLSNVWYGNRAYGRMQRLIREVNPDVVVLNEATDEWLTALRTLEAGYHFAKSVTGPSGFGILVLSRLPVEEAQVLHMGNVGTPSVIVRLRYAERQLTLIATHALAPAAPRRTRLRNRQLEEIAKYVSGLKEPVMVLGDLNTTSWSPAFRAFIRTSALRDSRKGFGLQPSWPVAVPLLRIPIDHCLVSSDIVVHKRWLGPKIGSDHFPIVIDCSLASSSGS